MIIGVTGFISAGKGELTNFLVKKHNFISLSFGDAVRAEAVVQGIENTRANLQIIGDTMRLKFGGNYWARKLLEKVEPGKNYVIEGIRNPEEVTLLRTHKDFTLICVDAPTELRAARVFSRKRTGDPTTMEQFMVLDTADKGEQSTGFGQNTGKCVVLADYTILNNETLADLDKKLATILLKIRQK